IHELCIVLEEIIPQRICSRKCYIIYGTEIGTTFYLEESCPVRKTVLKMLSEYRDTVYACVALNDHHMPAIGSFIRGNIKTEFWQGEENENKLRKEIDNNNRQKNRI
ncbi:hypothetical protein PENTCL1PPCAC_25552, partial [Pristionchus entomophagus]